jgi:hypothetical protein
MTRVILLNGPPRVGKNTSAELLRAATPASTVIGFSHHLKRMVHGIYLGAAGWAMDPDAFDAVKSEPQDMLNGKSWRWAYIHYSEQVIKPLHGKEWFGEMFVRAMHASGAQAVIVPDSGFREEAERTVREVGHENVLLIRLHRDGVTFAGDSRSYISLADFGVREIDIENIEGRAGMMLAAIAGELATSA